MKRLMFALLLTAGAVAGSPEPLTASADLALVVSPSMAMAPAHVLVRARVERNSANRGLQIIADSGTFFRSSFVQLDGDQAPTVTEVRFKDLPGGQYQVSVVLMGAEGVRATVNRPLKVVASSID